MNLNFLKDPTFFSSRNIRCWDSKWVFTNPIPLIFSPIRLLLFLWHSVRNEIWKHEVLGLKWVFTNCTSYSSQKATTSHRSDFYKFRIIFHILHSIFHIPYSIFHRNIRCWDSKWVFTNCASYSSQSTCSLLFIIFHWKFKCIFTSKNLLLPSHQEKVDIEPPLYVSWKRSVISAISGKWMHFMYACLYLEGAIIGKTLPFVCRNIKDEGKDSQNCKFLKKVYKPRCPKIGVNYPEISSHLGNNTPQCSTLRSKLHVKRVSLQE